MSLYINPLGSDDAAVPDVVAAGDVAEMAPLVPQQRREDQLKSSLASAKQPEKSKSFFEPIKEFFRTVRGFLACIFAHPRMDLYEACMEGCLWTLRGLLFLGKHADWSDEESHNALQEAYDKGQYEAIKLMVQKGVMLNDRDAEDYPQQTILHKAIDEGKVGFAVDLIDAGVNLDDGRYLYKACVKGEMKIVDALARRGVKLADQKPVINKALMPTILGGHQDMAALLIQSGATVIDTGILESACSLGQMKVVEALIGRGVRLTHDALKFAILENHLDIAALLVRNGIDLDMDGNDTKNTFLHYASRKGMTEIVDALLERQLGVNARNANGETPLHSAVKGKQEAIASKLLQSGAKNLADNSGVTPLLLAMKEGLSEEFIESLIETGEGLNAKDEDGQTALILFLMSGNKIMASKLIEKGADNTAASSGSTPLEIAYEMQDKDTELEIAYGTGYRGIVTQLLQKGVPNTLGRIAAKKGDLDMVKTSLGEGMFDVGVYNEALAWKQWNVASYLFVLALRNKVAIDITPHEFAVIASIVTDPANEKIKPQALLMTAVKRGVLEAVQTLIARGANPKVFHQETGWSLLHVAAALGRVEVVKELIKAGVSADVHGTKYQETPLHAAVERGQDAVAGYLIFQHYWNKPEMLNAQDSKGRTALHRAAALGYVDIAQKLIEAEGIDLKLKDNEGRTAFDVAQKGIAELILKKDPTLAPKQGPASAPVAKQESVPAPVSTKARLKKFLKELI